MTLKTNININNVLKILPTKNAFKEFYKKINNTKCTPVFVSQFNNPYYNFALEKLIFETKSTSFFEQQSILIYKNNPCIVMGCFQNPWIECNLNKIIKNKILLCRRESGGGTVYHDNGNLNFTYFTNNKDLNRIQIMESIATFLKEYFSKNIKVNKRCDLILDEKYKISGSAAKIKSQKAYHHFTLLCYTNILNLNKYLDSKLVKYTTKVKSTSTKSVVSNVKNLFNNFEEFQVLQNDFIYKFSNYMAKLKQSELKFFYVESLDFNNTLNNNISLDIINSANEFNDKNWIFNKTPKFSFFIPINNEKFSFYFEIKNGFILQIDLYKNEKMFINVFNDFDLSKKYFFNLKSLYLILDNHSQLKSNFTLQKQLLNILSQITFL